MTHNPAKAIKNFTAVPGHHTGPVSKILIANRGEIAVRIIRAARDEGLETVAVYAEPDRDAQHVKLADEAYALGGATAPQSYLVMDKLIEVAIRSGADAVHPGYGFLSENAEFAQKVIDAGLTWIGPSPESITQLGDKVAARHIETQCLADAHGNVQVVSTRDCSLQRRNQKLVEEAPAPYLTEEQSDRLYEASRKILQEAGYQGAGTCEFLLAPDGAISFLEVNTRLQVEHPVSEEVSGIDLVREQFRIARGEKIDPQSPQLRGHSFEFRINGEDAGRSFMPAPGTIEKLRVPSGPGVRWDSGFVEGDAISGNFDSMLAKLIVTGATREQAIERARRALDELTLDGLPTVVPFHRAVLDEPDFAPAAGADFKVHTRWIETDYKNTISPYSGAPGSVDDDDAERQTVVVEVNGKRLEVVLPDLGGTPAKSSSKPASKTRKSRARGGSNAVSGDDLTSPMQGTIVKVSVADGDTVAEGDLILVLEAMKMEQPINAHKAGKISGLSLKAGDTVTAGAVLATIK